MHKEDKYIAPSSDDITEPFWDEYRKWWEKNMRPPFDSYSHWPKFLSEHGVKSSFLSMYPSLCIFHAIGKTGHQHNHYTHVSRSILGVFSVSRWVRDRP